MSYRRGPYKKRPKEESEGDIEYFQVSLPRELGLSVLKLLKEDEPFRRYGFESVRDFVIDATRRRIDKLKEGRKSNEIKTEGGHGNP